MITLSSSPFYDTSRVASEGDQQFRTQLHYLIVRRACREGKINIAQQTWGMHFIKEHGEMRGTLLDIVS